jgi:hypothetical protein
LNDIYNFANGRTLVSLMDIGDNRNPKLSFDRRKNVETCLHAIPTE